MEYSKVTLREAFEQLSYEDKNEIYKQIGRMSKNGATEEMMLSKFVHLVCCAAKEVKTAWDGFYFS